MKNQDLTPNSSTAHRFRVWAPEKDRMILHVAEPFDARLEMRRDRGPEDPAAESLEPGPADSPQSAYFELDVHGAGPGTRYWYTLEDGNDYPDPASRYQPEGVHGPSEVVDHDRYAWKTRDWIHRPFADWVIYELHVGTFTSEGTFAAVIPRLDALAELGVTAIELMPVNQFPGTRNWGYDGAYPYAVHNTYGGPGGLKELVDACHARGLGVILDVVYNHWGPEGAYAHRFGPYTTDAYRTPWGMATNLDGEWSDGVREFVIGNMRHWFRDYRVDALRVDAVHAIYDSGARSFWGEARKNVDAWQAEEGRPLVLIAECDLNSPRVLAPPAANGYGFDAQWLDDFHHILYVLIHPEGKRHYGDFGGLAQLAKAYTEGFVHTGDYVHFRRRRHGVSSAGLAGDRFVVFSQNHDQVGNRAGGERLSLLVDAERLKLAAAALLVAPSVPLLFMGEEYGETAPFHFFADYGDAGLARKVREGRVREFERFDWGDADPLDPGSPDTFEASKLRWERRDEAHHALVLKWYRDLLAFRRSCAALRNVARDGIEVGVAGDAGLLVRRFPAKVAPEGESAGRAAEAGAREEALAILNFSDDDLEVALPAGRAWTRRLDSRAVGATPAGPSPGDRVIVQPASALILTAPVDP